MIRTNFVFGRRLAAALLVAAAPLAAARTAPVARPNVAVPQVQQVGLEAPSASRAGLAEPVAPSEPDLVFLDPGDFVWNPDPAAAGPVTILVSLPLQVAYVFRGTTLIGASSVSTGKPGHDTPAGTFPILQKEVDHHSSLYDDAPMPYMQRLTWDGVALHAGHVTGAPASHGCIRLPEGFARRLYGVTQVGGQVVVTDEAPLSPEEALAATRPFGGDAYASAR